MVVSDAGSAFQTQFNDCPDHAPPNGVDPIDSIRWYDLPPYVTPDGTAAGINYCDCRNFCESKGPDGCHYLTYDFSTQTCRVHKTVPTTGEPDGVGDFSQMETWFNDASPGPSQVKALYWFDDAIRSVNNGWLFPLNYNNGDKGSHDELLPRIRSFCADPTNGCDFYQVGVQSTVWHGWGKPAMSRGGSIITAFASGRPYVPPPTLPTTPSVGNNGNGGNTGNGANTGNVGNTGVGTDVGTGGSQGTNNASADPAANPPTDSTSSAAIPQTSSASPLPTIVPSAPPKAGGSGGGFVLNNGNGINGGGPVMVSPSNGMPSQQTSNQSPNNATIGASTASTSSTSSGPSKGLIAGAVVGGVVFIAIVIGIIVFCIMYRRKANANRSEKIMGFVREPLIHNPEPVVSISYAKETPFFSLPVPPAPAYVEAMSHDQPGPPQTDPDAAPAPWAMFGNNKDVKGSNLWQSGNNRPIPPARGSSHVQLPSYDQTFGPPTEEPEIQVLDSKVTVKDSQVKRTATGAAPMAAASSHSRGAVPLLDKKIIKY